MNAARSRRLLHTLASVAVAVSVGCSDSPVAPRVPLAVTLDQTRYIGIPYIDGRPGWSFRLIATITNVTDEPQPLPTCGGASLLWGFPMASGREVSAWDPAWACLGDASQPTLAPGASRVDTLVLRAPTSFSAFTGEIRGMLQGEFVFAVGEARSAPVTVGIAAVSR